MAGRSWSQMAGSEAALTLPPSQKEPVPSSSKAAVDSEKTVSLNDIMSEQLAVELQGIDEVQTQLAVMGHDELSEYQKQFLIESGLQGPEIEKETKRLVSDSYMKV